MHICQAKFVTNVELNRHQKCVHKNIKYFACNLCQAKFATDSSLTRHVRGVHEKLRPFECSLCQNKFGENFLTKTLSRLRSLKLK